jgi:hypothetical protein
MRTTSVCILLVILSFGVPILVGQGVNDKIRELPPSSDRYAILVGIEKYQDPNISPLTGPANDVRILKESLIKYAGFAADNIVVLSDSPDADYPPNRSSILLAVAKIQNLVPKNGLLLFMFSGHGIARGDKAYLLPRDSSLTSNINVLEDTSLAVELLKRRIVETGVGQVVVLLDACRDDPEKSKGLEPNRLSTTLKNAFDFTNNNKDILASAVFYATDVGFRAYIDPKVNQGYFTEAIVAALSGKAADNAGRITLSNLLDYVQTNVPRMVQKDFGPDKKQTPIYTLSGYLPAQLVFAYSNMTTRTPIIPASPVPTGGVVAAPDPRSPRSGNLDFAEEFQRNQTNELTLSQLGEAAFERGNYDWTIKFLEQAKSIQTSKVWMSAYPYLAAAYLLGQGNEQKFATTLDEMTKAMWVPNTYLNHPIPISFCISNLTKIRGLVPQPNILKVDMTIDLATSIAAQLAGQQKGSVLSVCTFYGEANQGNNAFLKEESCIIPNIQNVDENYHQSNFQCCGGGAASSTTTADIPPGIEVRTSGGHYWSVQAPKLVSNKFSLTTYCGPAANFGGGCNVKAEILAHYK